MNIVWYGTEKSYDVVATARMEMNAMLKANPKLDKEFGIPSLYRLEDDVGIVSIKGSLINGSAGWMSLFGVSGYDEIGSAIIEAVQDKKAKTIMYDIDSPGGSAKGVRSLGELITNVSTVKASSVFTDQMGSAAYWLGSAGGNITIEEMGMAGSIGALIVHTDYSAAMQKEGIKKTIVRAGVNKALANGIEPLSEEARADLQAMVDKSRDLFVNAVATNRGVTAATVESKMGQGKEFMGSDAVNVGLADQVGTFEDAIVYAQKLAATFKPAKSVKL